MYLLRKFPALTFTAALCCALAAPGFSPAAHANVYATNIKLNGAMNNITNQIGGAVNISFILNEPATLGTSVQILLGSNALRTISIATGSAGTLKGTNTVVWDGRTDGGGFSPSGTVSVSITPSASGFTNWTQTSTDTNAGNYVFSPRGIAVNNNPNSKYFGRVFVGNAANNGTNRPGDIDGILKANADGSLADEGQSAGGYAWDADGYDGNPHFLRYGQDDRIYALNWDQLGEVVAFDMVMSTNQLVLTADNYSQNPFLPVLFNGWGMFDITGEGTTNARIFLGDYDGDSSNPGAGLWAWHMTNGVADPNDHIGAQVIAVGGDLTLYADGGSMMDSHSNIFVGQAITTFGDADSRILNFTNWDGVTTLTSGSAWQAGSNDDTFIGNFDLALDSRANPKYVATGLSVSGGLRVLNALDGSVVTNGTQVLANLDQTNAYYGVAWDAVGNLYGAIDNGPSSTNKWRVFSPPGTNSATTIAVEIIQQIGNATPPTIVDISVNGTTVTIDFTAAASDSPSAFTLVSSGAANGNYTPVSGANISLVSSAAFRATATTSGSAQFYRIKR